MKVSGQLCSTPQLWGMHMVPLTTQLGGWQSQSGRFRDEIKVFLAHAGRRTTVPLTLARNLATVMSTTRGS
jgi:hypothetical protein